MPTEVQNTYNTDLPLIHMNYGGPTRGGQRLTISNRQVSSVSFYLKRDTALGVVPATGGFVTIYSLADVALVTATITDAEIQALSNSAYALFTKSITPTVINEEVRMAVGMNVDTSWNVGSCVDLAYQNTDVKASEYLTQYGSSWANNTTMDCAYQYAYDALTTGVVTTQAVTTISGTTATGNGNVTNLGVPTATQHGHCWKVYVSAASPPTTADSLTTNGVPAATGAFTSAISGLVAGTKYGVRAYVTNSQGTTYGAQTIFWADKGTVAPTDTLTRVSGISRQFWAGKGGNAVYDMQVTTGGISTTYIPPVGTRQEVAAVPQEHPTLVTQAMAGLAGPGFQYVDYVRWVNQRGPEWVQKTYGHIPLYQEWVKIMIDQFRTGAK